MSEESAPEATDTPETELEASPRLSDSNELLHNLGTPLTIICGHVQLLRRRNRGKDGSDADALERSLDAMEGAVDRMREVVWERRAAECTPDSDDETSLI